MVIFLRKPWRLGDGIGSTDQSGILIQCPMSSSYVKKQIKPKSPKSLTK